MQNETNRQVSRTIEKTPLRVFLFVACLTAGWVLGNPSVSSAYQPPGGPVVDYAPVNRGFILVNGSYLAPPYQIGLRGDQLSINGHLLRASELNLDAFLEPDEAEMQELERQSQAAGVSLRYIPPTPLQILADAAHATAHMRGIVVLSQGEAPLLLDDSRCGFDLLTVLLQGSGSASGLQATAAIPADLTSAAEQRAWQRIVSDFSMSADFNVRAQELVGEVMEATATGERVVKASLWADNVAYPLTLFAMIVVVVAFGHLLSNKPYLESSNHEAGVSPEARKVVLKSLLIFGLLSIVDLIWTLVASATGSMREMNPVGNELIADPTRLIMFKVMAVSLSITLLYALHRRPIAQMASWWSCLVLTLLTARWLTFNSMFM